MLKLIANIVMPEFEEIVKAELIDQDEPCWCIRVGVSWREAAPQAAL